MLVFYWVVALLLLPPKLPPLHQPTEAKRLRKKQVPEKPSQMGGSHQGNTGITGIDMLSKYCRK